MTPHQLLEHVRAQPRGRSSFRTLVRTLGIHGDERDALQESLDELVAQGQLVEQRRGHYAVPGADPELITGRLTLHRDGYGFVIPDRPVPGMEGDIYIPRSSAVDAMHGDRVLVNLGRIRHDGRTEGRIDRVLRRQQAYVVGEFRFGRHESWVIPHDDRVRQEIFIPPGSELPPPEAATERLGNVTPPKVESAEDLDGLIVNVELTQFPSRNEEAQGRVIEILGRPDDFGVDVEVIIRKFHLPHRFPAEVHEETASVSEIITAAEIATRRDFRNFEIVTIDGESARDFDDAVWVERLDNGNFALHVHIADVSHYVEPGTAIDREARLRGTSVYFPDRAVPMLPAELSTGICSLNPGVDRLVLSALLEIDNRGETVNAEFCRGVIRSVERMTYTNVNLVLERDPEQNTRYAALAPRFCMMRELAEILNRRRDRRGSIDFDLPEPVIEFDELGLMTGVGRAERNIAHRIIEEFMLAANEAVASHLEAAGIGSLYRIHELPDPSRVLDFEQFAATFGHSLGIDVPLRRFGETRRHRDGTKSRRSHETIDGGLDISPHHYQRLISRIEGRPEERIVSYQMLRSLKQARYSEKNVGHFALGARSYTHFTSPIRRYPDLVVHRILKHQLDAKPVSPYRQPGQAGPLHTAELETIATESSFTERRAADAERALLDWKKARFMDERLGDEFDAIVVGVIRYGIFVELTELFIEGFIPIDSFSRERFFYIDSFSRERFFYNEGQRAIIGERSKRRFTLGDRIKVRADRVSWDEMRPEFSWVDEQAAKPAKRPARRKR